MNNVSHSPLKVSMCRERHETITNTPEPETGITPVVNRTSESLFRDQ